jgi:hypothetical protein
VPTGSAASAIAGLPGSGTLPSRSVATSPPSRRIEDPARRIVAEGSRFQAAQPPPKAKHPYPAPCGARSPAEFGLLVLRYSTPEPLGRPSATCLSGPVLAPAVPPPKSRPRRVGRHAELDRGGVAGVPSGLEEPARGQPLGTGWKRYVSVTSNPAEVRGRSAADSMQVFVCPARGSSERWRDLGGRQILGVRFPQSARGGEAAIPRASRC